MLAGVAEQIPRAQHARGLIKAVLGNRLAEQRHKLTCHLAQLDTVLRPFGACQTRCDIAQVQSDDMRIIDIARISHTEQILRLEIRLEGFDFSRGTPGALEVVDGFFIDRKKPHGGAVFGRHVADGGAIRQAEAASAFAKKFDKLAHHFFAAQGFGHAQHQVGGRHTFAQAAGQLEPHHIGRQKINRLAQHRGFSLDTAHTPGHHADAVDHGGVAVGADQ